MKKAVVSTVLACLALRLAVLAGAGDSLAAWVQERGAEGTAVRSLRAPETPAADPLPPEGAAPGAAESWVLVAVTPKPEAEEGVNAGEEAPPEAIAADLSADTLVHNAAGVAVDLTALAAAGPQTTLPRGGAQVLIIHTHSSEAYTPDGTDRYVESDPYRTEDRKYSVIRVGDALAEQFEAAGLTVLHDREIYDYPSYTGSYSRSGAAVERYLTDNPTIRVVIDLHRDALGSGDVTYKTQAAVSGRTSAQVMMLIGTGANGLPHPDWQRNLALALYLQREMEAHCPGLVRPIELVGERYNQQLSPGMMILEVGSNGNTLREALTAAELFGTTAGAALAELLE